MRSLGGGKVFFDVPEHLVTTFISAAAIIIGTLIGGWFSWLTSKKTTQKNIEEQYKILEVNRAYEEKCREKKLSQDANIVRLDICTSIFQSIRTLKDAKEDDLDTPYPIPINKNYASSVSMLSGDYSLREISYIYQLYGIIEKLNYDILNSDFYTQDSKDKLMVIYEDLLKKIYGNQYVEILKIDIDKVTYKEIYNNDYIKKEFKKVLEKLDKLCTLEKENLKNCG
ncbi:hypothetical protein [Hathewaya histolytica]|uniref:hypothetical protein n=1 Tax=Hathewaya histolytica TaxID=1498 RepID=UPI0010FF3DC9